MNQQKREIAFKTWMIYLIFPPQVQWSGGNLLIEICKKGNCVYQGSPLNESYTSATEAFAKGETWAKRWIVDAESTGQMLFMLAERGSNNILRNPILFEGLSLTPFSKEHLYKELMFIHMYEFTEELYGNLPDNALAVQICQQMVGLYNWSLIQQFNYDKQRVITSETALFNARYNEYNAIFKKKVGREVESLVESMLTNLRNKKGFAEDQMIFMREVWSGIHEVAATMVKMIDSLNVGRRKGDEHFEWPAA